MKQEPNKYDSFFEETPAIAADEKQTYEKLVAIKKKMAQRKILTSTTNQFQAPNTLLSQEGATNKKAKQPTSISQNKEVAVKKTTATSKQVAIRKTKPPTLKVATKVEHTPKNKDAQKNTLQETSTEKSFTTSKKRPSFLTTPSSKKPVKQTIKKKIAPTTTTPQESPKLPAAAYRKRPNFVTSQLPKSSEKKTTNNPKDSTNIKAPIPVKKHKKTASESPIILEEKAAKPFNAASLQNSFSTTTINPATPPPTVKTKSSNTSTKNPPPITKTMQPLDNKVSSNTYGKGQGVHVTDSPYTEQPIPLDGKNLIPRSQEVHDILSYVPNWMVRWGNTVILLIIGGILVMSYYIKYPDVVKGMISINSTSPPVPLMAKAAGTLTLLKEDKEAIVEGELIGIIKSTADYQDVLYIKEELSTFQEKLEKGWNFSYYELPTGLQLGDLQGAYSTLFIKLKEKKIQHQSTKNDKARKQHINQQLTELEAIKKAKETSLSIKYQEYLKAKHLLDTRYKVLYKKGSISAEQMNAKESEVRNLLDHYQNDRMSFNEIKKRILDLNSNKVELDFQKADQSVLSESSLFTAYEGLKNSIHTWEDTYLLKAPVSGNLEFVQFTKDNMYLQRAQVIANIIPTLEQTDTSPTMTGELLMPTLGAGKAAIGQTVNVALNDYPKKQYGVVEGTVVSIADVTTLIPDGQGMTAYKVVVSFPKGLENTMKKEIHFKHNMQGKAEIITEDIRLIERFFHELRDLFGAQ